jgi:hypothetical protein
MTDQEMRLEVLKLALNNRPGSILDATTTGLDRAKQWYEWIKEGANTPEPDSSRYPFAKKDAA